MLWNSGGLSAEEQDKEKKLKKFDFYSVLT